jgi:hypothetical protein
VFVEDSKLLYTFVYNVEDIMKTRLIVVLGFALLLLNACATVNPPLATEADEAANYMLNVENQAFGRATRIIWVNPPEEKDLENKG